MDARAGEWSKDRPLGRERSDALDWAALFARYGPLALRLARGIVHHADQAEDAVQEAARSVLERSSAEDTPLATPEHARNYFLRAVHHRALDVVRRGERERVQPPSPDEEREPAQPESAAGLDEREGLSFQSERARRELDRLRPAEREALQLRYLAGLTYREIAERTGASISTLQGRVESGLAKLRERLGRD